MSTKCCLIFTFIVVIICILGFLCVFVGFPVAFMLSINIQRLFLFEPVTGNPHEFNLTGVVPGAQNFYITVSTTENVTLGVWHLLPQALLNDSIGNPSFNHNEVLEKSEYPVLLHCHGNGGNRLFHLEVYLTLTKFFHVIAFDYRGYGDSTDAPLTEEGLVQDTVELYKWLQNKTTADIYVWGHSMGTAVATHTVSRLRNHSIIPAGLILESPYTTLKEEALLFPPTKVLSWLPWFNSTILDPIWNNGFRFEITTYILNVDCPIMILHSKDDDIIPYDLAVKLHDVAVNKRNVTNQGVARLHLFPAELHYRHWAIYKSPLLPEYIMEHMEDVYNYKKRLDS